MKKTLVATLIAMAMLLALSAADVTKSTTTVINTNPVTNVTKSTTTTYTSALSPSVNQSTTIATTSNPAAGTTNTTNSTTTTTNTTTTTTPGFEAAFALTGALAVAFLGLRRRR